MCPRWDPTQLTGQTQHFPARPAHGKDTTEGEDFVQRPDPFLSEYWLIYQKCPLISNLPWWSHGVQDKPNSGPGKLPPSKHLSLSTLFWALCPPMFFTLYLLFAIVRFLMCCAVRCLVAQLCPLFATPWTVDCQSPLSMAVPRQEYGSR